MTEEEKKESKRISAKKWRDNNKEIIKQKAVDYNKEYYYKNNGELNYGWDIDHIIPISSAEKEEDLYKLNHYTNLRPLCSYTNRHIKKDKLNYEIV